MVRAVSNGKDTAHCCEDTCLEPSDRGTACLGGDGHPLSHGFLKDEQRGLDYTRVGCTQSTDRCSVVPRIVVRTPVLYNSTVCFVRGSFICQGESHSVSPNALLLPPWLRSFFLVSCVLEHVCFFWNFSVWEHGSPPPGAPTFFISDVMEQVCLFWHFTVLERGPPAPGVAPHHDTCMS